jgi:hypothetical protein
VALVFAGGGGATPPKTGRIVPGQSIAGVRLGMSVSAVIRRWGQPNIKCGRGGDGRFYCGWFFPGSHSAANGFISIAATRASGPVVMVQTDYRGWRTPQGIGVGSTKAALIAASGDTLVPGHVGGLPMFGLKTPTAGGKNIWTWFGVRSKVINVTLSYRNSAPL